ncbi:hypothetical protein CEK62_10800 [Alcanivorax sp. N3-2A]|nr:hypothetical protein CEK62_10800 [Alcanivorax sp. N3-2A]
MSKVTRLTPKPANVRTAPNAPLPRALEKVRERVLERAGGLLSDMLDGADDTLFNLSEKETDSERVRYFDAMRELRIQRAGLETGFRQALSRHFQEAGQPRPDAIPASEVDVESLALVQEEELETQVALDNLARRARNGCEESLRAFMHRLEYLFEGKRAFTEKNNPLDPRQLAASFAGALERLPLDIRSRLIVLKLFERVVLDEAGGLVEEANGILADAGVLPTMTRVPVTPPRPHAGARAGGARPASPTAHGEAPPDGADNPMFGLLQELLATLNGLGGPAPAPAAPAPLDSRALAGALAVMHDGVAHVNGAPLASGEPVQALSSNDLFGLLNRLQRLENALESGASLAGERSVRSELSGLLESENDGAIHALERADDDVINLVSMLFDFILDDENLPSEIKALIGRLQIPLLKVAISDKTFFSNERHDARVLLNTLARAGCQWDPQQGIADELYQRIHRAVHAVIDNYDDDATLFRDLLGEFDGYFDEQRRRAERVAERVREAEEGKALGEQASEAVSEYLRARLAGRALPDVTVRLLQQGWQQVLYLTWLRNGVNSEQWRRHTKVVDALVWSALAHESRADLEKLRDLSPKLLRAVRHGLESIEYDGAEIETLCDQLQRLHETLLAGLDTERVALPAPPPAPPPAPTLPEDHELMTLVRHLPVGQWLETDEGEQARRMRLAANIRDGSKLVFINRRGIKVEEFDGAGLAAALHRGEVRLIQEGALFDRALEAVIGDLRRRHQGFKPQATSKNTSRKV